MERALDVFNASEHPRTVGGVARSLGAPGVCVRPLGDRPSVVTITVMWELSWYRYEVDLSDEAGGVRRDGPGRRAGRARRPRSRSSTPPRTSAARSSRRRGLRSGRRTRRIFEASGLVG